MRRISRLIAVLGMLGATLLVGSTTASAAASACAGGAYPASSGATIMASTTTPFVRQTIEVSGINFCPNENVSLSIAGQSVGTAHTDASGSFDPQVVVPGPPGDKVLRGVGASGVELDRDGLLLHVRGSNVGGAGGSTGGGGGGLAFTGVQIAALCVLAVLLIGGGAFFARAGRRKSVARS